MHIFKGGARCGGRNLFKINMLRMIRGIFAGLPSKTTQRLPCDFTSLHCSFRPDLNSVNHQFVNHQFGSSVGCAIPRSHSSSASSTGFSCLR